MDNEHKKMKQIIQMSKVSMPFDDLEQRIMGRIEELEKAKIKALSDKKYAIVFFLLGSICGIVLNSYYMNKIQMIEMAVAYHNYISIFFQLIFVILICFFCLQLWKLIKIQQHKSYQ
ncbi:MAG: hypothetical protein K0S24_4374 [Sphingobacterium sp.]|jgi:hypothetical protein|nr:hypothetical protein [Sphingobacterium sp.]